MTARRQLRGILRKPATRIALQTNDVYSHSRVACTTPVLTMCMPAQGW